MPRMNMTSSYRKYKLIPIAPVSPPIPGMHRYRMGLIFRWSTNLLRRPLNAQVGFQDAFLTGRYPVRILMPQVAAQGGIQLIQQDTY